MLYVDCIANTTDVTETRYVFGSSQTQSTYRDKKDNTAVYLKMLIDLTQQATIS